MYGVTSIPDNQKAVCQLQWPVRTQFSTKALLSVWAQTIWDNSTWEWEPRLAPKYHTSWIQVVSTLGVSVALTKIRPVLYCVQTSIVAAKIQMSQRPYISALFITKITRSGPTSVMASSGAC